MAASWTNTKLWTYADAYASTESNAYIGTNGNLDFLASPPSASAFRNTAQAITNATWTTINFDQEEWDSGGLHSTSSNPSRFTISTSGKYVVIAYVAFAFNGSGRRGTLFRVNGGGTDRNPTLLNPTTTGTANFGLTNSTVMSFSAGDYLEVFAWQDSGGSLNVPNANMQLVWQSF